MGSSPREQSKNALPGDKAKIESRDPLSANKVDAARGPATAATGATAPTPDAPVVQPLPDTGVEGSAPRPTAGEGNSVAVGPGAGIADKPADIKAALSDTASPLGKRSVYFEFDKFNIRPEDQALVEAHGRFLSEHRSVKIRIEGNCDARGSRELNLSLGQRRADSVKKALMLLGAQEKQIQSVSYGSEKPKATGTGEEAWAENRRSDINYPDFDPKP